jgi:hypothetical protein
MVTAGDSTARIVSVPVEKIVPVVAVATVVIVTVGVEVVVGDVVVMVMSAASEDVATTESRQAITTAHKRPQTNSLKETTPPPDKFTNETKSIPLIAATFLFPSLCGTGRLLPS